MDFFSDDKPSVEIEPKSGGVFSDFNFFENTAPDLENISYADKAAYGAAQETTIGRNIFSAIKAGVESGVSDKTFEQALKDMEDERQRDIDKRFPRFRGLQESEEDLSILSGRIGVAVADPVTFMIPWLKLTKAGTLGQKMTKLGAAGAGLGATDTFTRDLALYGEVSPARTALGATIGAGSTLAGFGLERFVSNKLLKSLEDAEPSPATVNAPDLSVDEAGAVDSAVKSAASKIELDTPKITTRLSILQEYQKGVESIQAQIQKINERLSKKELTPDFDQVKDFVMKSPIAQKFLREDGHMGLDRMIEDAVDVKSRSSTIMITPRQFLALAARGTDESKIERVQKIASEGKKFEVNFINFSVDDKGRAVVSGHEGRHRAMYYIEQGLGDELMPVRFTSDGKREIRFGENQFRPEVLYTQDDVSLLDMASRARAIDEKAMERDVFAGLTPRAIDDEIRALELEERAAGSSIPFPKTLVFDDVELPISESLEKTLKSNKSKLQDQQKKLLDTFALKSMELADEKARLSAEAIENLAKSDGFTQKAARAIMTELTKPLYGAGSGAIYGFSTREDSEDMESVYVSAALGAGLGAAWKRIDASEAVTSMVKDQTKMVINEAGFNYARANLKHLFGGTTATKMDAMGGWNKVIGNVLFSRYGVAGDSVESRSLKAQSEWVGRLTNNLGDSGADDDVLEAAGEALFNFVPDDKLVGWKGLSGTRNALTEEQASEVRRIVPLLRESQDFIKNRVSETGIPFEELEFYGMALRFDFTKDTDKLRGHLEEAARIHNKQVKASGKGKKLTPKSYAANILGDNNAPNIKYGKGGGSPFKYDATTKQYTFRPLAEFFETSRSLTSPEAIKYLAQNDALVLNARDVLADYGSSSLKVAEFAEAVGPNGELINLALKRTKEAFKGKSRSIGEEYPITTALAQLDSALESSSGKLPAGSRYVDQLVGGVEAFWGKRGEYSKASDGLRIFTTAANLSYLTFVSLANFVDLTQPFVKSGVKASLQALKQKNISRLAPTKSTELGGKSFAEMSHFQYDPSFERELETLLKSKSINDNSNVSRATDWINSKFFEYVQLKNVTAVARKFAYDAGVNRAFNLSAKFATKGKMTKTLQKELDSLNLTVEDLKNIGKYSDVREAFDENNARAFLDKAGRAAAERDSIVPNVGNRALFSQTNSPLMRSVGQFLSWSQAKSSELNAMVRQIENGDVKLLHRMALAAPVMVGFEELRRAAQGLSGLYEKEETPEQVDELQRIAKGLERTGMFNNFQLSFIMDQARYTYNSEEFSAADSLSPALGYFSDLIGAAFSAGEDLSMGDKEGALKEVFDVLPPLKQIQSATKFVTGQDLLVDEPNTEREKQPVNFDKGGEVDVPRAPSEPDERIDKMTGRPYDQQAGTAFVDEEDPLRRLGFTGGGEIDPLKRLGFGA